MPWAAPTHFASRWGLRFRRRPVIPATSQPVSWSAQIDPAVILFRSGPTPRSGEPLTVEEIRAHASFARSEEHTSELQSLMRISYAVFCLKKKKTIQQTNTDTQ